MNTLKTILFRIGHFLLSIVRSLRKLICCRRKKDTEYVLPMTIEHVTETEQIRDALFENQSYNYQWETWSYDNKQKNLNPPAPSVDSNEDTIQTDENSQEDFFKDMVPQIRKPKKIVIRNGINEREHEKASVNRLAMDPTRIVMNPELGVIEDNPCNWENSEDAEQDWDPDALIREKKRAEQEKRRAEHQRRKQEKENKKMVKPESLSSRMLSLSESNDKHKYS
ncbi:receptor-binding cancer antigen expressed on SiSo cells [Parasteatoda tepidariorum]|uniref:receptor-binding cancer antigen expressed on SiSo cells n=1 Tax=Parasteatoda tepidariorum TaxID=114398 RepID=UPI00077FC87D|nr:uncharacterized protein LOC107451036 [Parasteatoda tepidariorum]